MADRINWIDWSKAIAVCTVVFCHLPQPSEQFYFRYLQAGIITIFFFLSGYLKKDRGSIRANWRKYWRGLILPYLFYNLVFLPYWVVRFYIEQGAMPTMADIMRPVIGALLFEHTSSFCEPLNGPLWYVPAILILHVMTDCFHKSRYRYLIMALLCVVSFFLYYVYRHYPEHYSLTPMGLVRRLPYYYLGYVMASKMHHTQSSMQNRFQPLSARPIVNGALCIMCFALSILFFYWHIHESRLLPHIALFYPFNLSFLFTVICASKLTGSYAPQWIVNLSVGTLAIIGLHWMVMGSFSHALFPLVGISWTIGVTWYEAILMTVLIVAVIYPVIVIGKRYLPILIGKGERVKR